MGYWTPGGWLVWVKNALGDLALPPRRLRPAGPGKYGEGVRDRSRGMRWLGAALGVGLALNLASCMWVLDFDELQSGDSPIALEDAAPALAKATCDRLMRCEGPATPLVLFDEDCVGRYTKIYQNTVLDGIKGLDPSRFEYHADLVPACIEAIRKYDCGLDSRHVDACKKAFQGKVAAGADCYQPSECVAGLYCEGSSGVCPGKCFPELAAGEPCRSRECGKGLECMGPSTQKKCTPIATQEGDVCGNGAAICALGLLCLGNPGHCQSIPSAFVGQMGNDCNTRNGPFCSPGLFCQYNDLQAFDADGGGTCVGPSEANAPCTVSVPDPCPKDYYCKQSSAAVIDGTCALLPTSTQACSTEAAVTKPRCKAETVCTVVNTNFQCVLISENGKPCAQDEACYSGYCQNGVCGPLSCDPA